MKQTLISQDLDFQKSWCRLNGRMLFDTGVLAMSIYSLVLTWPLRHIHDITATYYTALTQYWVGLLQSLTGWLNIFLKPLHHHSCPKLLPSQKSFNLQYNMLDCWDSSAKCLMFQVLSFFHNFLQNPFQKLFQFIF